MASDKCPVPVIDISSFLHGDEEQRTQVAQQWDAAMSSVGMVTIVGHGCPPEAIDALYDGATSFFAKSREEKMQFCLNKGYGAGGFVPQGVEAVARGAEEKGVAPREDGHGRAASPSHHRRPTSEELAVPSTVI